MVLLLHIWPEATGTFGQPVAPGPSAEDAGFEPARAVNPTRVPGERHRPLGESSVGHGNRAALAGCRRSIPGRVLDSRWTPCGVYPVNSPRAGRQQGSMG